MCKIFDSKKVSEILKYHIKDAEELKDALFKGYFSENSEESFEIIEFFKQYIETINDYIGAGKSAKQKSDKFPFVIFESIVEVEDMDDGEIYKYRIVPPYEQYSDEGIDCASCLSPLGRGLLLKRIGQRVDITIPTTTLHYTIKDITIPEEIIERYSKNHKKRKITPSANAGVSM